MQSARPELADFTPPKSLQNGKRVDHKPPVSMSVHAGMHASTGSELKPVDHTSPINNARFCRKEGAPEMMANPNTYKTPHQTAKEQAKAKNSAVLKRIKAVKVERGLWLKPGAKVKATK